MVCAMKRGRIVAALIVLALVVAGYGAWWLHAAGKLREGVAAWVEARRAEGWQITLDDVAVQGFPLRLQAVARNFAIGREAPLAWRWSGPRLVASAPPWIGRAFTLSAPGAHQMEFDAPMGHKTASFTAEKADGTVRVGDDLKIARIDVELGQIAGIWPDIGAFKAAQLLLAVTQAAQPASAEANSPRAAEVGRAALIAVGVDLPPGTSPALGPRIARADAEIVLLGAIPTAHTREALDAWRQAGGTLELAKLWLHWGEFQLEAAGTAALDSDLQPIGALTTRMWGVGSAIDALVAAGAVRARDGATAKVVLRAMAKPKGAPGVPPEVEAPLAVQDRRFYLGPVAIAPVPTIGWP